MSRCWAVFAVLLVLALVLAQTAEAGGKKKRKGRKGKKAASQAATGRTAVLPPVTRDRTAVLPPVTRGRTAMLPPVTRGRAAVLPPVTRGRTALLPPVTRGRAAVLPPVTRGRTAMLPPVTRGRAAVLPPVTRGRVAGLSPVTTDRAATFPPVTRGRAAGLSPVTLGRASGLSPITTGRAAGLSAVALDRAAVLSAISRSRLAVLAYGDGYVAPYRARRLVDAGYFGGLHSLSAAERRRATERLYREGFSLVRGRGSVRDALDTVDPGWPRRDRPGGQLPVAYYLSLGAATRGSPAGDRDRRLILVPQDIDEAIPEDFEETLLDSHFPVVIGDISFKEGSYVRAALAFSEAVDRKPKAIAPRFALGDALVALRNYGYAADLIRSALAAAPGWADRLDRNGVYGVEGDLERHREELEEFAEDHAKNANAWFLLGYLRMTSGAESQRKPAAAAFSKALDLDPGDPLSRKYLERLQGTAPVR